MKTKYLAAVVGLAGCMGVSGAYAVTPTLLTASEMDQVTAAGSRYQRENSERQYKKEKRYQKSQYQKSQKQESKQENKQFGINANVAALNNVAVFNKGDQNFRQSNEQKQTNVSVQYQR